MLLMPAHRTWAKEVVWPWRMPWCCQIASAGRTASRAHSRRTSEGEGLEPTGSRSRVEPRPRPGSCRLPSVTPCYASEETKCFATAIDRSFRRRSRFRIQTFLWEGLPATNGVRSDRTVRTKEALSHSQLNLPSMCVFFTRICRRHCLERSMAGARPAAYHPPFLRRKKIAFQHRATLSS
jgi:hypothetical protein